MNQVRGRGIGRRTNTSHTCFHTHAHAHGRRSLSQTHTHTHTHTLPCTLLHTIRFDDQNRALKELRRDCDDCGGALQVDTLLQNIKCWVLPSGTHCCGPSTLRMGSFCPSSPPDPCWTKRGRSRSILAFPNARRFSEERVFLATTQSSQRAHAMSHKATAGSSTQDILSPPMQEGLQNVSRRTASHFP